MITLTLKRDSNGNKLLQVKPDTGRAFSVQTLGNLPAAHGYLHPANKRNVFDLVRDNVRFTHCVPAVRGPDQIERTFTLSWLQVCNHVKHYGTLYQRKALGIDKGLQYEADN